MYILTRVNLLYTLCYEIPCISKNDIYNSYHFDRFCTNVKSHYIVRNHYSKTENMQCLLKTESIAFVRNFFLFHILSLSFFSNFFPCQQREIYTKVLTYFCQYILGKRNKGFQDSNSYFLTNTMQYWKPFSRISFRKQNFLGLQSEIFDKPNHLQNHYEFLSIFYFIEFWQLQLFG